ncbi:hypothetical protein GR160_17450 [Flavobacterium sp. Sd200]|uniref:hypothetical protein n=1 Tax=Flavobacterium sp. Sd200 TaxID=2692211 RepID=UPI0013690DCA|nr:hypothetical protein [Flavobacterium sp. Sd200]MXN93015.1 hypothetical protein [Flavobacterium sp. Sd200]
MILIASKYLVPKGYSGITLYPFIIVRENHLKKQPVLINHERIHIRQQAELLVAVFYLWYVTEFLIRFLMYKNKRLAYQNICFEREAYSNDTNPGYLKNRRVWAFIKYL